MREKNAYLALQASKGEQPVQAHEEKGEKKENRISVNVKNYYLDFGLNFL